MKIVIITFMKGDGTFTDSIVMVNTESPVDNVENEWHNESNKDMPPKRRKITSVNVRIVKLRSVFWLHP